MNSLMTNVIPIFIIPTVGVSLLLVSLVMLFARENAAAVLRQLYLYGVVITAFILTTVSVIGLLYTTLTTTVFPVTSTQSTETRYISYNNLPGDNELLYAPGVKDYLNNEQSRFQKLADQADMRHVWRDEIAWSVPLLLVFLPILLSYRRFLNRS